jgi:serine/threonine-protein kinase
MVTSAGVTMGTPIYMSPEQARGETLTTASDMFSFGLLLQTLFTGAEPYPAESTAHEVMVRAGRGESLPIEGVPHDIKALVSRLKHVAPSDRPTAVEALGRLQWVTARPTRILRYSIIAVLLTVAFIGVWRYTVDLQRERAAAVEARKDAERRRAQAEDLISFMVGDLRTKLEPVGQLEILDDVSRKTLAYINAVKPERMSASELARNAKALNQLGEVRIAKGDTPAAVPLFEKSLQLASMSVQHDATNAESRLILGQSHFWRGTAFWNQRKLPEAMSHMRQYLAIAETLAREAPANPVYQLERAYGHSAVGMVVEADGDLETALGHFRASMDIKQERVDHHPEDLDAQAELARAINKVGAAQYKLGNLRGALAFAEREVAAYRLLVGRQPKHVPWKQRLSTSMGFLARALADTGQSDRAYDLYRQELDVEEGLMAYDRENVTSQRNVAVTTRRVACVLARTDLDAALPLFRRAQSLLRDAYRKAPTETYMQVDLAALDVEYARALDASGAAARAQQMFRESARAMEPLAAAKDNTARVALSRSLFFLGESLSRAGQAGPAAEAWARAERELAPLVQKKTCDPPNFDLWTRILARRSRLLEAKAVHERLRRAGYEAVDLESFCSRAGC